MALDHGYPFAAHAALPTPTDTPYQTPSRGISRQKSSRHGSSSPFSDSELAQFPPGESYFNDIQSIESTSLHNPRFSQNLDISFIGEIHSLKKEVEKKDLALDLARDESKRQKHAIGELEAAVDALDSQLTHLQAESRAQAAKERALEQDKQSIQHDSNSVMESIVEERDSAKSRETDARKQLEAERTKKRALETDLEYAHKSHEQERQRYRVEARKFDRRQHVLESRLKVLVDQLIAVSASNNQQSSSTHAKHESIHDVQSARGFDTTSMRSDSRAGADSRMSMRNIDDVHGDRNAMNSRASATSNLRESTMKGLSLAEELEGENSDGEEENEERDELAPASPDALPEEVYAGHSLSRQSRYSEDSKARKIMGLLPSDASENGGGDEVSGQHSMGIIMDYMAPSVRSSIHAHYADAGTQFTPPPSPKFSQAPQLPPVEKYLPMTPVEQIEEPAANQSRKRIAIPSIFSEQTQLDKKPVEPKKCVMISAGCQTTEMLPTEIVVERIIVRSPEPDMHQMVNSSPDMINVSTQMQEDAAFKSVPAANRLSPMDVPVIAIHPPGSRPASSHDNVVLPPRTKNAGSQVSLDELKQTTSTGMQTEQIQVDKRSIKMPPKIRTVHVASRSRSPARPRARSMEKRAKTSDSAPPRIPRRNLRSPPPLEEEPSSPPVPSITDAYPGNNDNGPLNSQSPSGPRRPIRSESIFAGFDETHDELDEKPADYSDDDFTSAPPIRKTLSKVKDSWKLVPQSADPIFDRLDSSGITPETLNLGKAREKGADATTERDLRPTTSKTFHTKATAKPVQLAASKQGPSAYKIPAVPGAIPGRPQRARSPSEPTAPPPFPVPTRSSSRKIPVSASEGAASPTPYSTSFFSTRQNQKQERPTKKKILRKVQSAAAVTRPTALRALPPAMPPLKSSPSTQSVQDPKMRKLSNNQFILPFAEEETGSRQGSSYSGSQREQTGGVASEPPSQETTVVDAIAQTMVGEWMWKYVRKRTSFGITEKPEAEFEMGKNGDNAANSGVRHKRWVWLAPYERAVIWSGKQPTSGPALLGKGGRKRMWNLGACLHGITDKYLVTIQSVLDVKDDTPMPKGGGLGAAFDRSILILTPQRALKFTAVSRERHYIWLTALSFLSHSTQGMDDLAVPEPISQPEIRQPRPPSQEYGGSLRRTPVRDSIRLAKGKSRPSMGPHSFSSPPLSQGEIDQDTLGAMGMSFEDVAERPSDDAAEPPFVPRMTSASHTRKRSSTGPRIPVSSFSNPTNSNKSSFSFHSSSIRDSYSSKGSGPSTVTSRRGSASHNALITRSHLADTNVPLVPTLVRNDFFDAVGTVRMEAFVDRSVEQQRAPEHYKQKKESRKKAPKKKDMGYWGVPASPREPPARFQGEDPFRGF